MMKNKISCYVCLFASFVVTSISIQTAMDGMNGESPSAWIHIFEFFVAIFFVVLALYFKYRSLRDKDKQL
ncbi:hypothetical protein HG436_000440 [Candidatus Saccharibacteria bacterium]|nr:hypothetical protein [Candidatus Saccharibacteria bacterium]